MSDTQSIPQGRILNGCGAIDRPEMDYPFDTAADEAAFIERGQREYRQRRARQARKDNAKRKEAARSPLDIEIDVDEVCRLRAEGLSEIEIADRFEVSPRTITRKCGNRNHAERPLTQEEKAEKMPKAARLLKLGVSQEQVAQSIGVSQSAVSYWKRNGLLDDGRLAA